MRGRWALHHPQRLRLPGVVSRVHVHDVVSGPTELLTVREHLELYVALRLVIPAAATH